MWNYLFGGSASSKDAPKKAIIGLREQINMLTKKQNHLYTQIDEQDALARKFISSDKTKARNALKRKKLLDSEAMKITSQIEALENQLRSIESANLNLETMKAMKAGASAMKQIHGGITVDKVDQTMDDIREQAEISEEISEAISRSYPTDGIDEDELEDELEALEQEQLDDKLLNSGTKTSAAPVSLPDAPNTSIREDKHEAVEEEDEDEKALKALQAEMGL
ncbi:SNF7 [Cyberlindnera jadinii]|uniref:Vacuolar-sorting protein SNF7 n=1 Tax=Cyberlindnera jadinii (strain ATCC 18201 / CBS 1600 / BCRC 20928 / JCM 3617 / NBRC 0987 / NRRL Y-1542) TaxID=983966 RepID=A0A0H5C796_CYBJN|nr:Snf7-domain-containing protein [Cyberlindnera jadinii NRRL Y-1542]ODV71765.1 Snf7-domain-containing protein [Cyberlindnera jadinii NRRL Y-1542]CEP24011.1 SNF7 [Cyberlindnera jadinii]